MKSPLSTGPWLEVDEVASTQDLAKRLLEEGSDVPGVIMARHQTGGRGRFGRSWHSRPGDSLTMSLVFGAYPDHPRPWLIGMAVAVAAAGALHCHLRWPNDLLLGSKKLGGILTEVFPDRQGRKIPVVGVGVNVNLTEFPPEIEGTATSLKKHLGHEHSVDEIAHTLVARLDDLPEPNEWEPLRPIWMLFDATPGREYVLPTGEKAIGMGIGPHGELICSVDGETREVLAADALFGGTART